MRKTNTNVKRAKFFKRFLPLVVLIQAVILATFATLWSWNSPKDIDSYPSLEIVVEDKVYEDWWRNNNFYVVYGGERYYFPAYASSDKYSPREFYKKIQIGEEIDVKYSTRYTLMGKIRFVLDARNESDVYVDYDADESYRKSQQVPLIIFYSLLELVFLAVIAFILFIYRQDLKLFKRQKKKSTREKLLSEKAE